VIGSDPPLPYIGGMMGGMEKSTVYLTEAQKAALARTAAAEGRSEATLIRAGIDIVTARHRVGDVAAPYLSAGEAPVASPADRQPEGALVPTWMPREAFIRDVLARHADPGLRADLAELARGTTDDEPIP
jgi:hypothetical protein